MEKMFKKKLVGLKSVVRIKSERTIVAIGEYTQEVILPLKSLKKKKTQKTTAPIGAKENKKYWERVFTFQNHVIPT